MNADSVVNVLETVTDKLELFIQGSATGEEYYWAAGPNQGIAPKLRSSAKGRFKHFILQTLNSGRFALPFLFLQAIAYFAHTGLSLISAGLKKDDVEHRNKKLFSAFTSIITGGLVTLASICILLASAKLLAIIYAVQAGIDVVFAAKELIVESSQITKLKSDLNNPRLSNRKADITQKLADATAKKQQAQERLGWAAVILTLTICCFFVPVPIVPIIAQVGLAVVATYLLVKEVKRRLDNAKKVSEVKQQPKPTVQSVNKISPTKKPDLIAVKIETKPTSLWQKARKLSIGAIMTLLIAPAVCGGGSATSISSYGRIDAGMQFAGGITQTENKQETEITTDKKESKTEDELVKTGDVDALTNAGSPSRSTNRNSPNRVPTPEPIAATRKEEILIETEEEFIEPEESWVHGLRPR